MYDSCRIRAHRRRPNRAYWLLGVVVATAAISGQSAAQPAAPGPEPLNAARIRQTIDRLDASQFDERNGAFRELNVMGVDAIPFLTAALQHHSREVRFRVQELLAQNYGFEEVADPLLAVIDLPHGETAIAILRERAEAEFDATDVTGAAKLFKFWKVNAASFRNRVLMGLADAENGSQASLALQPLRGFRKKVDRFNVSVARLKALSLQHEHQYSPGFVITESLAQGLAAGNQRQIGFAERYLDALERLVDRLRMADKSAGAIRKEVSDRANMSDGAAAFLVQLVDPESELANLVKTELRIDTDSLCDDFFHGLAAEDARDCYRLVGKTHIVDMLSEEVQKWDPRPPHRIVEGLISSTVKTVASSDKPKALACLDALAALREMPRHGLMLTSSLGRELATALARAAERAASNRDFHPTRSVHDRIVRLIDLGVVRGHIAFPEQVLTVHLDPQQPPLGDAQRMALGRYVHMVERLDESGIDNSVNGVSRFLAEMRGSILKQPDRLAAGVTIFDQKMAKLTVVEDSPADALGRQLNQWLDLKPADSSGPPKQ